MAEYFFDFISYPTVSQSVVIISLKLFYKVYNYKKNVKIEDVSKDKEYQHKDIDFIVNGLGVEIKTDAIAQFSGNFVNEGFCQVKNYNKSLLLASVYAFKDLEKMQTNDMFPAGFMLKTQADILFCLNVQEKFNQKNSFRLNLGTHCLSSANLL